MKRFSKIFAIALASALPLASVAEKIVILHTNDTHSQIDPVKEDNLGGVARRAVLIDSVRNAYPDDSFILIDAGDVVQGSLFFNLYKGEVEEKIMDALEYDIRILGNHEFDNGMQALHENIAGKTASLMLCSNYKLKDTPLANDFYTMADDIFPSIWESDPENPENSVKVAFIPINIDPKGIISARNTVGMGYVDAIETANNLAWYSKNIAEADYVVAITHIGYENDVELASLSKDIDVIIGGHSHTFVNPADPNSVPWVVKNAEGKDVLVAQTGKQGKYVGEIIIDTENLSALPSYRLLKVDSRYDRPNNEIEEMLMPYRAAVDSLNTHYIATTAKAIAKDSPEALNFMADFVELRGKELADDVDLAIINKGGIRNSLPKGQVSEGEIITMMPFFNRVQVIEIDGRQLADAFDTMAAAGGNGISANVDATYDKQKRKAYNISISGKPIDLDKTYRVATIDYLAEGGDYMKSLADHKLVAESPQYLFEDMVKYLTVGKGKGKKINPSDKPRMKHAK